MTEAASIGGANHHLTLPTVEERAQLDPLLARERSWGVGLLRYDSNFEIQAAIAKGRLREFKTTEDLRPIARFQRDPDCIPYLSPQAIAGAKLLGHRWRQTLLTVFGIEAPEVRLAVTSMVRSQAKQDDLVAEGALAVPDSTHCTGHTFDIDNSGYYVWNNGRFVSVTDPRRAKRKQEVGEALALQFGVMDSPSNENLNLEYDPRFMRAAAMAANVLYNAYIINLVPEHTGTENACLHIAVNPEHWFDQQ